MSFLWISKLLQMLFWTTAFPSCRICSLARRETFSSLLNASSSLFSSLLWIINSPADRIDRFMLFSFFSKELPVLDLFFFLKNTGIQQWQMLRRLSRPLNATDALMSPLLLWLCHENYSGSVNSVPLKGSGFDEEGRQRNDSIAPCSKLRKI